MPKTADRLAPDWGHWLNMASVTVDEAIYLSLNVDPRIKSDRDFASKKGLTRTDGLKLKERLTPYTDRMNQVGSALVARNLTSLIRNSPLPSDQSQIRIQLQSLIQWVQTLPKIWDLPQEIGHLADAKPLAKENPRELASYQKLLIALVVQHYQYNPNEAKSAVPSKLQRCLERIDLSLDDETIRKCLGRSKRFLKNKLPLI